jgi:hypothetical protein
MLSAAALGMLVYGMYSVVWPIVDLVRGRQLELWAELALVIFGLLLSVSAAFVRVRLPGALALAGGAMLGLQALAVHSSAHMGSGIAPQIVRGVIAAGLIATAHFAGDDRAA